MFSIEKTLLNETHFRGRVCLSLIVKYWSLNLELADVKIWQIFDRYFWGDKLVNILHFVYIDLSNVTVPFLKEWGHI